MSALYPLLYDMLASDAELFISWTGGRSSIDWGLDVRNRLHRRKRTVQIFECYSMIEQSSSALLVVQARMARTFIWIRWSECSPEGCVRDLDPSRELSIQSSYQSSPGDAIILPKLNVSCHEDHRPCASAPLLQFQLCVWILDPKQRCNNPIHHRDGRHDLHPAVAMPHSSNMRQWISDEMEDVRFEADAFEIRTKLKIPVVYHVILRCICPLRESANPLAHDRANTCSSAAAACRSATLVN